MEERNVNLEEKPKTKSPTPLLVIMFLVIIAMGCVIGYLLWNSNSKKDNAKERKEEKSELREIYLTDTMAKELIEYVPVARPLELNDFAFLDKKVTVSEMDVNHLVYNAMKKVTNRTGCSENTNPSSNECDWTFKVKDVKESIKNLYGDVSFELPKEVKNNFLYICSLDGENYVCMNSRGGTTTAGPVWDYFVFGDRHVAKYQKAEKDANNLYIYVKFARIAVTSPTEEGGQAKKASNYSFKVYKYGNGDELIADNINGKQYCDDDSYLDNPNSCSYRSNKTLGEKVYDAYKDKMITYKITYKIDERDNYTLYSVEPVK